MLRGRRRDLGLGPPGRSFRADGLLRPFSYRRAHTVSAFSDSHSAMPKYRRRRHHLRPDLRSARGLIRSDSRETISAGRESCRANRHRLPTFPIDHRGVRLRKQGPTSPHSCCTDHAKGDRHTHPVAAEPRYTGCVCRAGLLPQGSSRAKSSERGRSGSRPPAGPMACPVRRATPGGARAVASYSCLRFLWMPDAASILPWFEWPAKADQPRAVPIENSGALCDMRDHLRERDEGQLRHLPVPDSHPQTNPSARRTRHRANRHPYCSLRDPFRCSWRL